MATTYGSLGFFGLASEEAKGLYAANATAAVSTQTAILPDHQGDAGALAIFGEQCEINLQGVTVNAGATGQTIAGVLDIANTAIYGRITGITLTSGAVIAYKM